MAKGFHEPPMLDELESGPWPKRLHELHRVFELRKHRCLAQRAQPF